MTKTKELSGTLRSAGPDVRVWEHCNPLLITFVLRGSGGEIQVRCRGCREIFPLPHRVSGPLTGIIELDGQRIPVIDANVRLRAEGTEVGHCSCILVVEHECGSKRLHTGVIVSDIEEVMQLAAGTFRSTVERGVSVNMSFVVETCRTTRPHELLAEAHRELDLLDGEHARLSNTVVMGAAWS